MLHRLVIALAIAPSGGRADTQIAIAVTIAATQLSGAACQTDSYKVRWITQPSEEQRALGLKETKWSKWKTPEQTLAEDFEKRRPVEYWIYNGRTCVSDTTSRSHSDASEELKAMKDDKQLLVTWMWADAGLPWLRSLARRNPLRWSPKRNPEDTIQDLSNRARETLLDRKYAPVQIQIWSKMTQHQTDLQFEGFDAAADAMKDLEPVVSKKITEEEEREGYMVKLSSSRYFKKASEVLSELKEEAARKAPIDPKFPSNDAAGNVVITVKGKYTGRIFIEKVQMPWDEAVKVVERWTSEETAREEMKKIERVMKEKGFQVRWMFGDAGVNDFHQWLARLDPIRWSDWKTAEGTVDDFEKGRRANQIELHVVNQSSVKKIYRSSIAAAIESIYGFSADEKVKWVGDDVDKDKTFKSANAVIADLKKSLQMEADRPIDMEVKPMAGSSNVWDLRMENRAAAVEKLQKDFVKPTAHAPAPNQEL